MKANFTLSVIREKRHVALFNMPLLSTSDFDKGLLKDDFMMSVKMSTYLVAFIICDFKNVSAYTKQNILVRFVIEIVFVNLLKKTSYLNFVHFYCLVESYLVEI